MRSGRKRAGVALVLALVAVVVVTALMVAMTYRVRLDTSIAMGSSLRRQAMVGAESAVWSTLSSASAASIRLAPIGTVRKSVTSSGEGSTTVMLTRTDTSHVWIVADVTVLRGRLRARYRTGMSAVVSEDTIRTGLVPLDRRPWLESF
jgi:hypothetical protein